jgi:hypothetical protein
MSYIPSKYRFIKVRGRSIRLARYLIEQKLKRKLSSNECIHHIDGNTLNDDLSNIELLDRSDHSREHIRRGDIIPFGGCKGMKHRITHEDSNLAWCGHCKKFLPKSEFGKDSKNWSGVKRWCKSCRKQEKRERRKEQRQLKEFLIQLLS